MFIETTGNLFEAKTEALINAVNCVGVMGKGIALQFKQKFPAEYFNAYKIACQNGELAIGIRFGIWECGLRISTWLRTNPKSKIEIQNRNACSSAADSADWITRKLNL